MNNLDTIFGIVNAVWRSAKLSLDDPGTVRVWEMATKDLTTSTILAGCEALSKSEEKFAPNPGRFRRICLDEQEQRRQAELRASDQRAFAEAHRAVQERTPRERAWAATQSAFCRRVLTDHDPNGIGRAAMRLVAKDDHGDQYGTHFDWRYVVESAPLPRSSSSIDHGDAWAELKVLFEREWAQSHELEAIPS